LGNLHLESTNTIKRWLQKGHLDAVVAGHTESDTLLACWLALVTLWMTSAETSAK